MLDFELIKNENIVKKIDVSNKNEFSDTLLLTNKRLIKIKKEKYKTQLNIIPIEDVQEVECNSILPNSKSMIWSITAFLTGLLLYLAFKETMLGILFFLFLISLGIYLIVDHLSSKKYQKLIFKTISNNITIEYTIELHKSGRRRFPELRTGVQFMERVSGPVFTGAALPKGGAAPQTPHESLREKRNMKRSFN